MSFKNSDKILLILDLDETLIHARYKPLDRAPDFNIFEYAVYKRPYLLEFLQEMNEDFLLAIWSSASDDYVNKIVKKIIPDGIILEFCWGRKRCTYRQNIHVDDNLYYATNTDHYNYQKPLRKVKKKGYSIEKILIVDDSPHKCQQNYGNAIYPMEYNGEINDKELLYLSQYLKTLKDSSNVRNIEKRGWRNNIKLS